MDLLQFSDEDSKKKNSKKAEKSSNQMKLNILNSKKSEFLDLSGKSEEKPKTNE